MNASTTETTSTTPAAAAAAPAAPVAPTKTAATRKATARKAAPKATKPAKAPKAAAAPAPTKAPKAATRPRTAAKVAPAKAKASKGTKPAKKAATSRDGSKKAIVIDMMRAKSGATMAAIMKVTDWQTHTVRGFVAGMVTKKMGLSVESTKNSAWERCYRIAGK